MASKAAASSVLVELPPRPVTLAVILTPPLAAQAVAKPSSAVEVGCSPRSRPGHQAAAEPKPKEGSPAAAAKEEPASPSNDGESKLIADLSLCVVG